MAHRSHRYHGITAVTRLPGANYQFDHLLFLEPLQLPAEAADPKSAYGGYMHILVPDRRLGLGRTMDQECPDLAEYILDLD